MRGRKDEGLTFPYSMLHVCSKYKYGIANNGHKQQVVNKVTY